MFNLKIFYFSSGLALAISITLESGPGRLGFATPFLIVNDVDEAYSLESFFLGVRRIEYVTL